MESTESKNGKWLSQKVAEKEKRKLEALRNSRRSVWFGLGMFGMIGWSVAVPMVLGALLGIWLDKNHPQSFSWTLTCIVSGILIGIAIAANWVSKEEKEMHHPNTENDE